MTCLPKKQRVKKRKELTKRKTKTTSHQTDALNAERLFPMVVKPFHATYAEDGSILHVGKYYHEDPTKLYKNTKSQLSGNAKNAYQNRQNI